MSDAQSSTGSGEGSSTGRVGAWTDAERNQFMLRIMKSLLPEGKGVDWKTINMPGRTTKALQCQWTAILAQMRDIDLGGDGNAPAKPHGATKKATKKTAIKGEDVEDANDEGVEETPKKPITPKKRATAGTNGDGPSKKRRTPAKKRAAKVEVDKQTEEEISAEDELKAEEEQ